LDRSQPFHWNFSTFSYVLETGLNQSCFTFQASFSLNVSLLLRKPLSNSGQNPILRPGTEVSSNAAAIASDSISNSDLSDELDLSHDGNGGRINLKNLCKIFIIYYQTRGIINRAQGRIHSFVGLGFNPRSS
jgi:hypothetical protein